ncbi:MAG: hypothetical protein ORN28_02150 [Rhodoferax sp.]|nr:hypothetical protein [Rhodoferax sp.]
MGISFSQPIKDSVLATADRRFAKYSPAHLENEHTSLLINRIIGADSRLFGGVQEQSASRA